MSDHYATLGVERGASQEEIKRAYRRLARQYHPDANADPAAEERFKELGEAYEILSDPERRRSYDMFGDARGGSPFSGFGFGDLGDIMETFFGGSPFGGARRHAGPAQGEDLAVSLEVSLEEAAAGAEKRVSIDDLVACERCSGNGCEPGTFRVRCSRCSGAGEIRSVQRSIFGQVMTSRACPACGGAGDAPASACTRCHGAGAIPGGRWVDVAVPAGVASGMTLRVGGRGRPGPRGGPSGDLYVGIAVLPHPVFERDGDDLHCAVAVPFTIATLGGEVMVPVLGGEQLVRVAPGTPSGHREVLRGEGMPRVGGRGAGDLVARLVVEVPRDLTPEQRGAVEELARLRGEEVAPQRSGLGSKLRDALRKER